MSRRRRTRSFFSSLFGFLLTFLAALTFLWANQASGAVVGGAPAAATEAASAAPTKGTAAVKTARTTDVNFEDVLVQGKYHFSDEAVTTVEEDKVLDSLLGVRKDFQDRIKKSVSRQ